MAETQETYPIEIGGVKRNLRLFEIKPGLKIAIINILGDTELVNACTAELVKKLDLTKFDVMVTAEAKTENVIAARQAGCNNYIIKPFTLAVLKQKLTSVLGEI